MIVLHCCCCCWLQIVPESPAGRSQLQVNDEILGVDGQAVRSHETAVSWIRVKQDRLVLTVNRLARPTAIAYICFLR